MPTDLLTAPQVAEILGVSAEAVRNWTKGGKLDHITLPSGAVRYRRSDIDAILNPPAPAEASS